MLSILLLSLITMMIIIKFYLIEESGLQAHMFHFLYAGEALYSASPDLEGLQLHTDLRARFGEAKGSAPCGESCVGRLGADQRRGAGLPGAQEAGPRQRPGARS